MMCPETKSSPRCIFGTISMSSGLFGSFLDAMSGATGQVFIRSTFNFLCQIHWFLPLEKTNIMHYIKDQTGQPIPLTARRCSIHPRIQRFDYDILCEVCSSALLSRGSQPLVQQLTRVRCIRMRYTFMRFSPSCTASEKKYFFISRLHSLT